MRRALLALVLLAAATTAWAGTCSSKASGNWNGGTATTWNTGCTGTGGSPAAGDTVTISDAHTVTVTAAAAATSVSIAASGNSSILAVNSGVTLNVSGNFTINAPGNNNVIKRLQVGAGAQVTIGGALSIANGNKTGELADLQLANDPNTLVTIGGSITFTSSGQIPSVTFLGAGTLAIAGNFGAGGTLTPGSGTVLYNGSGAQTIGLYTYSTLAFNKSAGTASASGNVTAAALNFRATNAGLVSMAGGTTLTITGSCVTAVTRSGGGHVIGNLRLTFPAGDSTCIYFIGDAANYTPLTIAMTGAGGGTLTGNVTKADHPQKGTWDLNATKLRAALLHRRRGNRHAGNLHALRRDAHLGRR